MTLNQNQPTPDATTLVKGKVQLAGDLSGTAAAPTVANQKITPSKLATGAAYATVATSQATTTTTYTDLATVGPAATVAIGVNGLALVTISAEMFNGTAGSYAAMAFAISGATTRAAAAPYETFVAVGASTIDPKMSYTVLVTGLASGSTTFTAKYRAIVSGTATFVNREISVVPL